jgi:hypothetical protein
LYIFIFFFGPRLVFSNPTIAYYVETSGGTGDEKWTGITQSSLFLTPILAGWTRSFGAGGTDVLLSRYDASGSHVSSKVMGGTGDDIPYSIMSTSDGKYIIAGYTRNYGLDLFFSKFDANLNFEWTRVFAYGRSDMGFAVAEAPAGYYVVAGLMTDISYSPHIFLADFDANGNLQWQTMMTNGNWSQAYGLTKTYDGCLAVTGFYAPVSILNRKPLISKFSSGGVHLWTKLWSLPNSAYATSIVETATRDLVVAGLIYNPSTTAWDLFVAKCDSLGNNLWAKKINNSRMDTTSIATSLGWLPDNKLLVTGTTQSWGQNGDILISMLDMNGNHIYSRAFGSDSLDQGPALFVKPGGYYVAGSTSGWDAQARDALFGIFFEDGHTCLETDTVYPVVSNLSPIVDTFTPQMVDPAQGISSWSPTISTVSPASSFVCWQSSGAISEERTGPMVMTTENVLGAWPLFFNDEIILRFKRQTSDPLSLTLYTSDGRMILNEAFNSTPNHIKISGPKIEELPDGIYFLHAVSAKMNLSVLKLIKRRN